MIDELRDLLGVVTDDDVLGHHGTRRATVVDRVEGVVVGDLALVEVRPLDAQRAVARSLGAGRRERVAAGAVLGEEHGACLVLGVGDGDILGSTGGEEDGGSGDRDEGQWAAHGAPSYFSAARMAAPDPAETETPAPAPRFREAMARFPTGVTVITALTDAGPAGLSANAVSSLSLEPQLMLACLDRGSRTLRAVEEAGRFGVNVLADDAAALAVRFAQKVPVDEKWTGVGWSESHGIPILDAAIVWIGCELRDVISGGDHVIVTGAVLAVAERDGDPLIFHRGAYRPLD